MAGSLMSMRFNKRSMPHLLHATTGFAYGPNLPRNNQRSALNLSAENSAGHGCPDAGCGLKPAARYRPLDAKASSAVAVCIQAFDHADHHHIDGSLSLHAPVLVLDHTKVVFRG